MFINFNFFNFIFYLRYYFTSLRINSQTENILVPIHAFPVIDRENIRNVFPRLIDFGVIEIGESRTIVIFK